MRVFDFNSFADLSLVFDLRKGQLVPTQAPASPEVVVAAEPMAQVILYSTTSLKAQLAQSRFVSLSTVLPTVKPFFLTASAKKVKPVIVTVAPVVAVPVTAPVAAEEPKKARTTLKLKTKVELPVLQTLSRNSTTQDLAAAFKAERALLEKKAVQPEQSVSTLEDAFTKRRRHPLSNKSWSELLAEVEAPKQKQHFDLAAAYKAEMKAFMAEQEKLGNTTPATTLQFKSAADHKVTHTRPQASAPRLAA